MDPFTVSSAVATGLSFVGDVFGGIMGSRESRKQRKEAARQFNEQMDFQKNATQYRVKDALKAGINPLAALGVSSNVSPTISSYGGDNSMGNAVSRAGDRLSRMFEKLSTRDAVEDAEYKSKARALDLESKEIQNQIDRARLGVIGQPGVPLVEVPELPSEVGVDDEIINAMVRVRNRDGTISYYPSPKMAELLDVEFSGGNPYAWQHVGENKLFPSLGGLNKADQRKALLDWWYNNGRPRAVNRKTGELIY